MIACLIIVAVLLFFVLVSLSAIEDQLERVADVLTGHLQLAVEREQRDEELRESLTGGEE